MANDIPADVEIERVYIIEATYAPDAAETRPRVRPQHLARIAELMAQDVVIEAGGYLDLSSSIVMLRAPDEQAALAIARDDIYMREGVWVELRVKPFGRVVRTRRRLTGSPAPGLGARPRHRGSPHDPRRCPTWTGRGRIVQDVDRGIPLGQQAVTGSASVRPDAVHLAATDDGRVHDALRPARVTLLTDRLRQVEDDRDRGPGARPRPAAAVTCDRPASRSWRPRRSGGRAGAGARARGAGRRTRPASRSDRPRRRRRARGRRPTRAPRSARKWRRANVVLPAPDAPTSSTSPRAGDEFEDRAFHDAIILAPPTHRGRADRRPAWSTRYPDAVCPRRAAGARRPNAGLARARRRLLDHVARRGDRRQPGLRLPAAVPRADGRHRRRPPAVRRHLQLARVRRRRAARAALGRLGRQVQPQGRDHPQRAGGGGGVRRRRAQPRAVAAGAEHDADRAPAREHRA